MAQTGVLTFAANRADGRARLSEILLRPASLVVG